MVGVFKGRRGGKGGGGEANRLIRTHKREHTRGRGGKIPPKRICNLVS